MLIKRVRAGTECAIGEEQSGFRQGRAIEPRGCKDQLFFMRKVCQKYLANTTDVFWAFVDFENGYD